MPIARIEHLRAWFIEPATRMNPNLQYAQAIHGRFTGRGTGIIDTIHLVEVARAAEVLDQAPGWQSTDRAALRGWFTDYLTWLTTHEYGIAERDAKNNHGTCWVMQVAAFAHLTGDEKLLGYARDRFKTVLVPNQIAPDGSFPEELRRTKPYGYSLFNLDAMTTVAEILSTPADNLWTFETAGRTRTPPRDGIHGSVHQEQEVLAEATRRHVRRRVADASSQPALRGPGAEQTRLPGALVDAASGLERGRGDSKFLRAPAGPLDRHAGCEIRILLPPEDRAASDHGRESDDADQVRSQSPIRRPPGLPGDVEGASRRRVVAARHPR